MNPNISFAEQTAVLAAISPVSQGAGTVTTGWLSFDKFQALVAVLKTGVLGSSATVDMKFQQATDASGTGAKDVTGRALTQIVKATGDNKVASIEVHPGDLDTANNFTHVRASLTVGTAASLVDVTVLGIAPTYLPARAYNAAAVVQQIGS
jgi:uncharacterized protein (UPF0333 family)